MSAATLVSALAQVSELVSRFKANESRYLSGDYQEAEVRKDFIDKFFIALGWDVNHDHQTNPYEQEVKVEPTVSASGQRRADYAFYLAPNFRNVRFFVEALEAVWGWIKCWRLAFLDDARRAIIHNL